jgi:threonylcarbamoyladenosine tRNA methylthiotransferase MtaB
MEIANFDGHTRAVMKIQEGCDRYCAFCIIPYVRGGIRSREVADVRAEAMRLSEAGYSEVVLTGIHLSSYGRDLEGADTLLDAVRAAAEAPGIRRIRLGSLEPVIATEEFVTELAKITKLCPQFHLSLQSGSDRVLKAMRRRYTAAEYLAAAHRLQAAFPGCALTTDVITGFPGETEEEFRETMAFCREAGFARIHVFPYSRREGTPAASMEGQLPKAVREERARRLIALADELADDYRRSLLDTVQDVLFEEESGEGASGYTPQYVEVWAPGAVQGQIAAVRLHKLGKERFEGVII